MQSDSVHGLVHGDHEMGVRVYRTHNVHQVSHLRPHKHEGTYTRFGNESRSLPSSDPNEWNNFQVISRSDQLLPYYVLDVAANVPGLPGLFLAGLVSAGLSTMSANLNTVAGTIYEDFIDPWLPDCSNKENRAANIMKVHEKCDLYLSV